MRIRWHMCWKQWKDLKLIAVCCTMEAWKKMTPCVFVVASRAVLRGDPLLQIFRDSGRENIVFKIECGRQKTIAFGAGAPNLQVIPARELVQGPNGRLPKHSPLVNPRFVPRNYPTSFSATRGTRPRQTTSPPTLPFLVGRTILRHKRSMRQGLLETTTPRFWRCFKWCSVLRTLRSIDCSLFQLPKVMTLLELANKCREQTKLENHLMLCDPGYGE